MAPIDPGVFEYAVLVPLLAASSYVLLSGWLVISRLRTILRAYRALPVAQRIRSLDSARHRDVWILSALAIVSFLVHFHHTIDSIIESYELWDWDSRRSVFVGDVWSSPIWLYTLHSSRRMLQHIGARLLDFSRYEQTLLACIASTKDYWWAQQHLTGTIIWTLFVAIECRRRNISGSWKIAALPYITGLACAHNLFGILLLLTPIPLADRHRHAHRKHSSTWAIRPEIYSTAIALAYVYYLALPSVAKTDYFKYMPAVHVAVVLLPIILTESSFIPEFWATRHSNIYLAHRSHLQTFRNLSFASFILHGMSIAAALSSETTHTRILFSRTKESSQFFSDPFTIMGAANNLLLIVRKLLGAVSDNPAVSQVAWDVILSSLSLCAWVALRELEPRNLFITSWFSWFTSLRLPAIQTHNRRRSGSSLNRQSRSPSVSVKEPSKRQKAPVEEESDPEYIDGEVEAEVDPNAEYLPPGSLKDDAAITEHEEEADHEVSGADIAESVGAAWGSLIFGGLGTGAASVLGADAVSR